MIPYIIRRSPQPHPDLFSSRPFLAWIVIEMAPGDFASQFAFNAVDPNKAARIRESLGLNDPWYIRYFYWLRNRCDGSRLRHELND